MSTNHNLLNEFGKHQQCHRPKFEQCSAAMVVAMADPDGHQGKAASPKMREVDISRTHIGRARTVLRHAPDLAPSVRQAQAECGRADVVASTPGRLPQREWRSRS